MKLNTIIQSISLLALVTTFGSCKNDDYELPEIASDGYVANTQQAFFSNTQPTTIEITSSGSTFSIPVHRMGRDAATVRATSTVVGQNLQNIQGGQSVAFAAGAEVASLVYTYDPTAVRLGQFDTLQVTIAPECATAYGANTLTFLVGQSEPWISLGTGYFSDEFLGGKAYPVEILQNGADPRCFRIMHPYDAMAANDYPAAVAPGSEFSEYMEITLLQPGDVVGDVTITQTDLVYFTQTAAGYYEADVDGSDCFMHVSDGFVLTSDNTRSEYFPEGLTEDYFLYSTVTSYQEPDAEGKVLPATIQLAGWYGVTDFGPVKNWYYATSPTVNIVFPGVEILDLSSSVTFQGLTQDFNANTYASLLIELGDDVARANLYLMKYVEETDDYEIANARYDIKAGDNILLFPEMPDGYYYIAVEALAANGLDYRMTYSDDLYFEDGELATPPVPDEGEEAEPAEEEGEPQTEAHRRILSMQAKAAKAIRAYKATHRR